MPKHGNPLIKLLARDLIASFGAYNLNNAHETGRTSLSPQKIQVHDDWNPNLENFDADIAIVTFEACAITFSTYVQPICLWNEKTAPTQTEGYLGGWGQSENLNKNFEEIPTKLKVPIHTNEDCFLTTKDLADLASNRTFCAGRGDGTGTCTGDSGGGLSIKVGSTFYFRGIISSGLWDGTSCDVSKYSIFTDVLKFKLWINQKMNEDGEILDPKVIRANLRCTFAPSIRSNLILRYKNLQTCDIDDQKIDGEGFSIAGDSSLSIRGFFIRNNKEVKFLPENIVEFFPRLIAYEVRNCSIRTVNEKHFESLSKLEYLSMDFNEIDSIDADSFKDLIKLEFLKLNNNQIKKIDQIFFQSLGNLWQLRLGYNQIEVLDEKSFDNLRNIRNIELSNNELNTIPANLFKNNLKLEKIFLFDNKIQIISSTMFNHLYNLNYVGLRKNVCVNDLFLFFRFNDMKNVLSTNCTSPV